MKQSDRPAARPVGARDHWVGALLFVTYLVLLLATSRDLAMSRDESFYYVAAERYSTWFHVLFTEPAKAFEQPLIDRAWEYNHEHPSLMKSLFALSWLAHSAWDLFPVDSMAFRFPGMVVSAALLWILYIFGARAYGREVGAFAALAFALLPRPFYHAHLDAFDMPITTFATLTTYCYWRSLTKPSWAIWTGVVFGLALATKHNSWTLPIIFAIHYAWVVASELRKRKTKTGAALKRSTMRLVPWWLIAMLTIGPVIFVGSWPWLWNDTWARFEWYAKFHLHHEYYNMAYFGRNYFLPPFPISYPFVMTLYTVPLTILVMAIAGIVSRASAFVPPFFPARFTPKSQVQGRRTYVDVLLFGSFVAPMLIIALPSTPIFGGTKHWFPGYPFMTLFAGVAFARIVRTLRVLIGDRLRNARYVAASGASILLLTPSTIETIYAHPFALSHYTFFAGGVAGAADDGMNRQFWGFTTGSLAQWFREQMPNGGTVWICDTTAQAWEMMQRDGMLPENIHATGNMVTADFAIVHHEHHFAEVDFQAWIAYGSPRPVHVLTYGGVPIISVYENPNRGR